MYVPLLMQCTKATHSPQTEMARRTKEEAQATRSALLDAAEHVFHAQGVSRSSLAEIAQAAGTTRGAIYWHFKDKADLFNAMMERVILPLEASVLMVGEGVEHPDALQELRRGLCSALRLVATDSRAQRVFEIASHQIEYVGELAAVRQRRIEGRDACMAKMEAMLRLAAQNTGVRLALPAADAAFGLSALIDGVIRNWLIAPGRLRPGGLRHARCGCLPGGHRHWRKPRHRWDCRRPGPALRSVHAHRRMRRSRNKP